MTTAKVGREHRELGLGAGFRGKGDREGEETVRQVENQ